jgi:hypothetical protein
MATCLDLNFFFLHSGLLKTWQQTSRTNLSRKFDNLSRIKPNSASLLGIPSTTKQTLMQQQQQQHLVSTPPSSSLCLPVASTLHISAAFSSTATTPRKKEKKAKNKGVNPLLELNGFSTNRSFSGEIQYQEERSKAVERTTARPLLPHSIDRHCKSQDTAKRAQPLHESQEKEAQQHWRQYRAHRPPLSLSSLLARALSHFFFLLPCPKHISSTGSTHILSTRLSQISSTGPSHILSAHLSQISSTGLLHVSSKG